MSEHASYMTPTSLRQTAHEIRELRKQLMTLVSAGIVLNDDILQQASEHANEDLVSQWKASSPDVLDLPVRELVEQFRSVWHDIFIELGTNKVWGSFTDTSHPHYTEDWWVKLFVVFRGIIHILVGTGGERLLHVGIGVVMAGLVVWLLGISH